MSQLAKDSWLTGMCPSPSLTAAARCMPAIYNVRESTKVGRSANYCCTEGRGHLHRRPHNLEDVVDAVVIFGRVQPTFDWIGIHRSRVVAGIDEQRAGKGRTLGMGMGMGDRRRERNGQSSFSPRPAFSHADPRDTRPPLSGHRRTSACGRSRRPRAAASWMRIALSRDSAVGSVWGTPKGS